MAEGSEIFVLKALESLSSAQSEFSNRRFNRSVNRRYYACFHAAAAALIQEGPQPRSPSGQLRHEAVHGQFVGELLNRRHRFPSELRTTLALNQALRQTADYEEAMVSQTQAARALRRSEQFVDAVTSARGGRRFGYEHRT